MILWPLLLGASLVFTLLAYLLAPVLPLFADDRGWLPKWLWWFQTPDNDLDGDRSDWTTLPVGTYRRRVLWLLRNPAYGFDLEVLGAHITPDMPTKCNGDPWIKNRNKARAGCYFCWVGGYWNFKGIVQISADRCFMLELGWKLQPYIQHPDAPRATLELAQFVFSPRLTAFYP